MTINELKKKAKDTEGEVIKRDDGNYRLYYKTIYDTSKWTLPEEILAIKDSIDNDTQEVIIHGIVRKRKDIPKCISKHVSFNSTKAFKRWIGEIYREMTRSGYKIKILKEQAHLPRNTKYRKASGVTYVSGLKCYVCNKPCLQAWTTWKKGRKATCSRKCMDRGMFHDMQNKHDGKWWDKYGDSIKGYKHRKRKDPKTGKIERSTRHKDNFVDHYKREPKKGHHLHHINMCKGDDEVSNLIELNPTEHQATHTSFNKICKGLMEMNLIGYNHKIQEYYIKETT